jgi:hypothetical protein
VQPSLFGSERDSPLAELIPHRRIRAIRHAKLHHRGHRSREYLHGEILAVLRAARDPDADLRDVRQEHVVAVRGRLPPALHQVAREGICRETRGAVFRREVLGDHAIAVAALLHTLGRHRAVRIVIELAGARQITCEIARRV